MAAVSRTAQFAKVFKVLKKHYKPVIPHPERPVLEQLLLACCLEDAHYDAAEEAFAALVETFFDWNEVRVTTIPELAEVMSGLPDPRAAANRLKRVLQSVFEETYTFDLEDRRKQNLGPTVKWLSKMDGTTNFSVAYLVQSALGGHAIPVDSGVLQVLRIVDLISDKDVQACLVPGLERAISKAKGIEFGSMLHQLGADFTGNRYSPGIRKILLQINPDCQDQLPKRRCRKKTTQKQKKTAAEPGAAGRRRASAAKQEPSSAVKKKSAMAAKRTGSSKPKAAAAQSSAESEPKEKKSAAEGLSKRKPR